MSALVLRGDARNLPLPDASVDLIVTSPPYFAQRDYQDGGESMAGQIGGEDTPREYLDNLLACTAEWMRVLKPSGSIFVNLGDKYSSRIQVRRSSHQPGIFPGKFPEFEESWAERSANGATRMPHQNVAGAGAGFVPEKSLMALPWRYAIRCTDELGLILRQGIIWRKLSAMPESAADRCATRHEYVFHLTREAQYYSAVDEIREPGSGYQRAPGVSRATPEGVKPKGFADTVNPLGALPGSVWTMAAQPFSPPAHLALAHHAAFPVELPRKIILGWSPSGICAACDEGRRPVSDKTAHGEILKRNLRHIPGYRHPSGSGQRDVRYEITGHACACPEPDAPTRSAVVVDPFGGTGTTALVADTLGRAAITVDRSADYCRLAQWRTTDPAERARALGVPKPPPVMDGQLDLFGGVT